MPSQVLSSGKDLTSISEVAVINFWAEWAAPCAQTNAVFEQLSDVYPTLKFFKVDADADQFSDVVEKFEVTTVPTFVFTKSGKALDRVVGANVPDLAAKLSKYSQLKEESKPAAKTTSAPQNSEPKADLNTRLAKIINTAPVMLFMKGSAQSPECGFSRKIVDILKENKIEFSTFNILADEEVRQGLKTYSNWPTYPQLYINGNLIGGLDIVKEMAEEGELASLVPKKEDINTRLEKLLNSAQVMLFMKGTPESPQCGFSRKIVDILKEQKVEFSSFNILVDEEVRQGLKTYSNWPTYPQLYSKGKLVGGLDIVKELVEDGSLQDSLA